MRGRLKALSLASAAVLAIGAVAAEGAAAFVEHTFKSGVTVGTTHLTGDDDEGVHKFEAGSLITSCETSTFSGQLFLGGGGSADTITLTPKYENCKIGTVKVTVDVEDCHYVLDSDTTESLPTVIESAALVLDCEHKGSIKVTAPGCTIEYSDTHPGNQFANHLLQGLQYVNVGAAPDAVTAKFGIHEIDYRTVGKYCILFGKTDGGTYSDGTYTGNSTIRAYEDTAHLVQVNFTVTTP